LKIFSINSLLIVIFSTLFSGCGSQPTKPQKTSNETNQSSTPVKKNGPIKEDLYAVLTYTEDGYRFKSFSKYPDRMYRRNQNNETQINLSNLMPSSYVKRHLCSDRVVSNLKKCPDRSRRHKLERENFHNYKTIMDPAYYVAAAVSMGLTTLTGLHEYEVIFDTEKFDRAVNEALSKIDPNALTQFVALWTKYKKKVLEFNNLNKQLLDYVYARDIVINDYSGFSAQKFDFKSRISFRSNAIITDFKPKNNSIEFLNNEIRKEISLLDNYLDSEDIPVNVQCSTNGYKNFIVEDTCPKTISAREYLSKGITLDIVGKKFTSIYPKTLKASDNNFEIVQSGSEFKLTNFSNHFMEIKAISCYYQDKVFTKEINLTLAPRSHQKLYPKEIGNIINDHLWIEADLAKLKKTNIKFGVSGLYKISGNSQDKSVYFENSYNLASLLNLNRH